MSFDCFSDKAEEVAHSIVFCDTNVYAHNVHAA